MADRDNADLLEIRRRQLRQYHPIYLVVAEGGLVSFEAETPQPRCDVHSGVPELVEQRFGVFEIGSVEAFGKPTVDRC